MRRGTVSLTFSVGLALTLVLAGCGNAFTEPPPPDAGGTLPSGDLLVVGDWGSGTAHQQEVADAMSAYSRGTDIAAIVSTGDNFYSDAADELMEPWDWAVAREIPFVVAWGNHDVDGSSRVAAVNGAFDRPPRWAVYHWGDIDVVVLDSNQVGSEDQLGFLEDTLRSSRDPTIVVFHHPPYSCGGHGDRRDIIDDWVSRFDDDVFLVLSGHDHNYQRYESGGVTYLVTGGGGRRLYELTSCPPNHPEMLVGETTYHFVALENDGTDVIVTAIDTEGDPIDSTRLTLP